MNRRGDQPLRILVMRHGETDWNRVKRVQGTRDIPLNDRGRAQVRAAAQRLAHSGDYQISQIMTSPLGRAKESALICQEVLRVPLIEQAEWRERSFGRLEGMTTDEIQQIYQVDDFEEINEITPMEDPFARFLHRQPMGPFPVESIEEITHRITRGLHRIVEQASTRGWEGDILLVTHGSMIKRLARMGGLESGIIPNAEFMELWLNRTDKTIEPLTSL